MIIASCGAVRQDFGAPLAGRIVRCTILLLMFFSKHDFFSKKLRKTSCGKVQRDSRAPMANRIARCTMVFLILVCLNVFSQNTVFEGTLSFGGVLSGSFGLTVQGVILNHGIFNILAHCCREPHYGPPYKNSVRRIQNFPKMAPAKICTCQIATGGQLTCGDGLALLLLVQEGRPLKCNQRSAGV